MTWTTTPQTSASNLGVRRYHTGIDAESTGSKMDDGDIGTLNEIDRKIRSACIMGVDITEIYSPERVAKVAKKFGLISGSSMDLTNGWNFDRDDHKKLAWKRVKEEAPIC